jgi:hypothetical protein
MTEKSDEELQRIDMMMIIRAFVVLTIVVAAVSVPNGCGRGCCAKIEVVVVKYIAFLLRMSSLPQPNACGNCHYQK